MKHVNFDDAKADLEAWIADVEAGSDVVITKLGRPIARLCPIQAETPRPIGYDRDLPHWIADDFDSYVPPGFA